MEYLLELLNKVQQVSPLPIFEKEVIVVQNAGMQHWLNMSVANTRGISMNIDYALPAQFLWKLARSVASKEVVPDQSPYSREVLSWRIYRLLQTEQVLKDTDFATVVSYFSSSAQAQTTPEQSKKVANIDDLKQYQLAVQLADLFEQYLIFRPDWLHRWQAGDFSISEPNLHSQNDPSTLSGDVLTVLTWQAKLWSLLQAESAYNPETLIKQACQNLADYQPHLPKRICFFGINAMAPMWLEFIHQLSEYTQVHFFHLNPCADYWGDIKSEKQAFKQIDDWTQGFDDFHHDIGNPLLANLGQQGREFLALLQGYSTYQFDVFEQANSELDNAELTSNVQAQTPSILSALQHDILTLHDARQTPQQVIDDSITITSAHSPLREVQGLHDWLLHQFNQDHSLTPKDVLVMCPQIEQYAPYVDAVFARGWQELANNIPPLPCSIADRVSKDAEPLVAAFVDLLSLPDSRFQVSQLLGFLRLNAVQAKFNFTDDELDKISAWLAQANIHWGLDKAHKAQVLSTTEASSQFTWQQGLSRLMRGFAFADHDTLQQEQFLLSTIEGSDAILLGQLMLVLEQLQHYAQRLNQTRTPLQWQQYLHQLVDNCFADTGSDDIDIIHQAIEQLVEYSQEAQFVNGVSLAIVQEFLNHHFSQPDPGRQFMVGQVTFCSMLPMRSIPFKVIAVLGLNDGDFPRQRKPQAFDLMQQTPSRIGDRSRRGDDRYLFLEALISARQALYLSYQGRNIKNNSEKQPSLVLKELFAYLTDAYGWQCQLDQPNCHIRQLPMQAFSEKNYQGKWPGFDLKWLELVNRGQAQHTPEPLAIKQQVQETSTTHSEQTLNLTFEQLIQFFVHPAKCFAEQQLDLSFRRYEQQLSDHEPFTPDPLSSYLYRQAALDIALDCQLLADDKQNKLNQLNQINQLSGELPELPSTPELLTRWQQDSQVFAQALQALDLNNEQQLSEQQGINLSYHDVTLPIILDDIPINNQDEQAGLTNKSKLTVNLTCRMPVLGQHVVVFRSSTAKAKDLLTMALYQLILQEHQLIALNGESACESTPLANISGVQGVYFDTKAQKVIQYQVNAYSSSQTLLSELLLAYLKGQQQALLLNAALGETYVSKRVKNKPFEQTEFELYWQDNNLPAPLGNDPYIRYFWPKVPEFSDYQNALETLYFPLFSAVVKKK